MFTSTSRFQVANELEKAGFVNRLKAKSRAYSYVRKYKTLEGYPRIPQSDKGMFSIYSDKRVSGNRVKVEVIANSPLLAEEARGIIQDLTETYPIIADNKNVIAVWMEEREEKPFIPRQPRMPNPRHSTKATRRS